MNKLTKSVLITDVDNTLFDWFDIWSATFIPMLDKVVEVSGLDRGVLIKEIKEIHQKHGTAEYAFLLEEIPSLISLYGDSKRINIEMDSAIHAARSNRIKHLKLYKGVYDTLSELRCKRIKVVAYTESKSWYTKNRLKKLGLDYFIDSVYSPADHDKLPIEDAERTNINFENTKFFHTPPGALKPDPELLLRIIEEQGSNKEECVYIGDSIAKDIEMAKNAGVTSVLAEYGSAHFNERPSDYNLLREVTHWTDEDVQREKEIIENSHSYKADYKVSCFSELLDLIEFKRK
ncbi:HAD family hydrolase [Shewanella algae]|uniref:HAD family hydrolase n=1 Tax=Shewanella algae TaxID=38313 RepID=UPI0031F54FA7